MRWECKIPYELPSLNEHIKAERTRINRNTTLGSLLKRQTEQMLVKYFNTQRPPSFVGEVSILFEWYCKDRRKDKDNIAFAKKYILDALQTANIIKSDGFSWCTPLDVRWVVDPKNTGVKITIESVEKSK